MSLMFIMRHVDISIKWSCTLQKSGRCVFQPILYKLFGERRPKTQVVDNMRYVGHMSSQVVSFGLCLDVEVTWSSVHLEEASDHASGVILILPGVFDCVA